ncbi:MAG: sodium/proline symporter [Deltaproteobacteria bacterium]|nr:sodium/proline symporter [Deltaproteobacteria bacterium]
MTLWVFLGLMGIFLAIGIASVRLSRGTVEDYYVASRSVSPALAGLSAVATNNSGYMFIGVIGFTYTNGLSAIWLMFGWILGDFLASLAIHARLRRATGLTHEPSYVGALSRWMGNVDFRVWRRIASLLSLVFLGVYAAAQIKAGSKALHGVLGWDPALGAVLVAVVVLVYSTAGGIRASIWTDAAQSFVMIGAMGILCFASVDSRGGISEVIGQMREIPGFVDWMPRDLLLPGAPGLLLFIVGWLFAGLSVIGQPHVMVRFMALDDEDHLRAARAWYYSYFIAFYALATAVGMLARLELPELASLDPELALPTMSVALLPPAMVGVLLAGIFAATMSTADSLVLACSATLTTDLPKSPWNRPWQAKLATAATAGFALAIALTGNRSVFDLVVLAWSTLACAFAPLLIVHALGRRIDEGTALAMLAGAVGVALSWRAIGWHDSVYEGLPGILTGTAIGLAGAGRLARRVLDSPPVASRDPSAAELLGSRSRSND